MKKYYYTTDAEGEAISPNANIYFVEANSEEEAKALIVDELKNGPEDVLGVDIQEGDFGDAWIKAHDPDFAEEVQKNGFKGIPCSVRRPGTHPGGNAYWITPYPEVYVRR